MFGGPLAVGAAVRLGVREAVPTDRPRQRLLQTPDLLIRATAGGVGDDHLDRPTVELGRLGATRRKRKDGIIACGVARAWLAASAGRAPSSSERPPLHVAGVRTAEYGQKRA